MFTFRHMLVSKRYGHRRYIHLTLGYNKAVDYKMKLWDAYTDLYMFTI